MNGPEHYRRAEALLVSCQLGQPDNDPELGPVESYPVTEWNPDLKTDEDTVSAALAAAQVHATLALAAATWDVGSSSAADEPLHRDEWSGVTS